MFSVLKRNNIRRMNAHIHHIASILHRTEATTTRDLLYLDNATGSEMVTVKKKKYYRSPVMIKRC